MVLEKTDEPQVTEELVAPDIESTTEPVGEKEIDYKAELEKAQATITNLGEQAKKLEHQLASNAGVLKQRLDLEASLGRIYRRLDSQTEMIQTLAQKQATGDIEGLPVSLANIQRRSQQEDAQDTIQVEINDIWAELQEEAGDAGLNLFTAPELAGVRALWDKGFADPNKRSMKDMRIALREAKRVRREVQQSHIQSQIKQTEEKANERLRKSGVVSTPVPMAAGRGAGSDAEIEAAVAAGRIAMTPEITARLNKYWSK